MIITGIEVIRGNPGALAAQANPGLAVEAVPPEKIELTYGDKLRINTNFDYRAPTGIEITLVGSIGQKGGILHPAFDSIITAEAPPVTLPKSVDYATVNASVDVPIVAGIAPKADYDIQCQLKEYPDAGKPEVDDVITITGIPPTFELLEETIYPYAYIYEGDAEVSIFTFKSDPFTPASWVAGRLADRFENEVRKAGGRVIEMRVYCDKSPLLWTDWRIEVVGISPGTTAGLGMSLGLAWWAAILVVAFAIIAVIIVATLAIKTIVALFKRKPELDKVKVGWKKETLILTIQDSEEYWERTPTPIETLAGMSEDDLRHLLNKIVEEEVPTGGMGLGLVVAGAGVLGLGALAVMAMSMGKKPESKR